MRHVVAVDVGGTHFRVALFDFEGRPVSLLEGETLHSGGRDWMLRQLHERIEALRRASRTTVEACGVSFGGPVNFKDQRVTSVHTPGWKGFELAEWVHKTLGLRCLVDNDANCGALGEHRYGAARGAESLVYITLSTGIGGGIITHGRLHRGRDSMAGEIGHIPLAASDDLCTCGLKSGCTEALASGRALERNVREFAALHPEKAAALLRLGAAERLSARELIQAAREGDADANAILQEAAQWLGRALLVVIRLLDPDKIVLGGGVAQAGDFLLNSIHAPLKAWWSPMFPYTTEIALAQLGDYSPLYGAAGLAIELAKTRPDARVARERFAASD
ncbi:MAG: ROK family protein [Terriglobia bacterium]